jgi:hypothetical protein
MTDRYAEAIEAAVESDGHQTTSAIKKALGIGYNAAARFTERMVADGILSEPNNTGCRTFLRNFMGCCEPCGAPLFEDDQFATDDNGCTACVPAFYDDAAQPGNYPCYAERVGGLSAASAMSTGTAKTPKAVEGRSPASATRQGDAQP